MFTILVAPGALAEPIPVRDVAGEVMSLFTGYPLNEKILQAAKTLFTALATISLVWTMGMLIVRQDIGELLMELLRFIVVTGTFYWLLINASVREGGAGFIDDIVASFFSMVNDSPTDELVRNKANGILARGLHVFYRTVNDTGAGDVADRLLTGGIGLAILVVCAVMAAQFLLALVMAWVLGYAGIFLLGFGGARWTSSIAINFYKHVVAIGVALLALSIIGTVAAGFLDELEFDENTRFATDYPYLGLMLAASILMMVLSTKLPQLLYTLVTGSTLGMYAGSASAAGTAIASAGSAAMAMAAGRLPGDGHGGPSGAEHTGSRRMDSIMGAVQRSASAVSDMSDPIHVGTGQSSFGMVRSSEPYRKIRDGSVFTGTQGAPESVLPSPVTGGILASTSFDRSIQPGRASTINTSSSDEPAPMAHGGPVGEAGSIAQGPGESSEAPTDYEAELATIEASRNSDVPMDRETLLSANVTSLADAARHEEMADLLHGQDMNIEAPQEPEA